MVALLPAPHLASRLVAELAEHCRRDLLRPKWLLAPSRRIGRQWAEQVVRCGIPVVNLHVRTLPQLALELGGVGADGSEFLSDRGGEVLLDRLLGRLRATCPYFAALRPGIGLARAVRQSLTALRLAGFNEGHIDTAYFEQPGKGEALGQLLAAYRAELRADGLVDYADALRRATASVSACPGQLPAGLLVLLPDDMPLSRLERDFVNALPPDTRHILPTDAPPLPPEPTDADRLRCLASLTDAPLPRYDDTAQVFRAVGEVNEVREVLRRCLAAGRRLDEVELLHTDTQTYVPLLYELFARLRPEQAGTTALPVTFAEGIPVRYARPGRALALWLAWLRDDFPQEILVCLVRDGLVEVPQTPGHEVSLTRLAGWFQAMPIGFGRERYLSLLDEEIAALDRAASDRPDEDDNPSDATRRAAVAARLAGLRTLRRLVDTLLQMMPPPDAGPDAVLRSAEQFLERHVRAVDELDRNARLMLLGEVRDMARWLGADKEPTTIDVRAWLAELPGACRVLGQGPRPGCLHVAHVLTGGHSGRPHLAVVGLDDTRFPGAGLPDPLLLDGERRRLSLELPTAVGQLRRKLDTFARLLSRHHASVTLSYSGAGLRDDRELFPSPVVMGTYRLLSGHAAGDQADLVTWLGTPASFAPSRPEGCLDESEWWLWRLCGTEEVIGATELIAACFSHLGRGFEAARQRVDSAFTAFDGLVPEAGRANDPLAADGPVMSSHRLETLGRCPRAYFFRYLLGLVPAPELALDPSRWLNALEAGQLLHEVFEQFFALPGAWPLIFDRDWPRLEEILDKCVRAYRRRCPPPHDSAFHRQVRSLRQAARIFLREEEEYGRDGQHQPAFLEVAVGMPNPGRGTALDSAEPVTIPLPGGRQFRARAWIDRLDRVLAERTPTFAVWDYKTGSPSRYPATDPFRQGRIVQPSLYLAVAQARLRQALGADACVAQFGFVFPSERGRGDRVVWMPEQLADSGAMLLRLCQVAGRGAFPATNDPEDCRWCDFLSICGDPAATARCSQAKLDATGNTVLQPFLRLRTDR
ncbi:MAG: PD-(D/E)XK nuclease family protein [Gemmataceae bacterium]|nr:PD-(D/E)XK nuclease family protein [Gemmataceae bacterium]